MDTVGNLEIEHCKQINVLFLYIPHDTVRVHVVPTLLRSRSRVRYAYSKYNDRFSNLCRTQDRDFRVSASRSTCAKSSLHY